MIDPRGTCPITHDVYLKLWSLERPKISSDFLLFDEAQDANPVMLDLVMGQDAQKILVGDRYQQIYSWRGAVNAMQSVDMPYRRDADRRAHRRLVTRAARG
jgi:cyanophycinase-like exopeptidase